MAVKVPRAGLEGASGIAAFIGTYPGTFGTLAVSSSSVELTTSGGDFTIIGSNFGLSLKAETDDIWLLFATSGAATAGTGDEIKLEVADGWQYFPMKDITRVAAIRASTDATLHIYEHLGA